MENCAIDVPGYYVLDRSWNLSESPHDDLSDSPCSTLNINASITLDLGGYLLYGPQDCRTCLAVMIYSGHVTLRNGRIDSLDDAIDTTEVASVRLERIDTWSAALRGPNNFVIGSSFISGIDNVALYVSQQASNTMVRDSRFRCSGEPGCVLIYGINSHFVKNIIQTGGVSAYGLAWQGSGRVISGNIVEGDSIDIGKDPRWPVSNTIVSHNILLKAGIYVSSGSSGNILEANIVIDGGIGFTDPGNFFGNNRVNGPISGTEGQTDWGGNVSF
jgi:hypothetical protein